MTSITITKKIVHHHFNGDMVLKYDNTSNNAINKIISFRIRDNIISFNIEKLESINSTDRKLYINKVFYNNDIPGDIINMFKTLNMLNTPTVFYLLYNMDFNVYYLKNVNYVSVFMLK